MRRLGPAALALALLMAAALAAVAGPTTPARALTPDLWGFAYVDDPLAAEWTDLPADHQAGAWQAADPDLRAQGGWMAQGTFKVKFPKIGFGSRGIVHVTAVGPPGGAGTSNYCQATLWEQEGDDEIVHVKCQQPGGAAADTSFTVLWTVSSGMAPAAATHAYGEFDNNAELQDYNSTGGAVQVVGNNGLYQVRFAGVGEAATPAGDIQVTAVSPNGAPRRCKVRTWGGTVDIFVYVSCHDANGNQVAARFNVSYHRARAVFGATEPPKRFGYLWCRDGVPVAGPTNHNHAVNLPNGCAKTAAVGRYRTTFPQLGVPPTHAQVTAQGDGSGYCTITELWSSVDPKVDCYDNLGAPLNHSFLASFTSRF